MDSTALRALNLRMSPAAYLNSRLLSGPIRLSDLTGTTKKKIENQQQKLSKPPSSIICSSSPPNSFACALERNNADDCSNGTVEATSDAPNGKLLQVVLVSPQIPGNTGCIARTCAASAVGLHLVEPLGYKVDDSKLKRAGLDYWPYVVVKIHASWADFRDYFRQQDGEKRLLAFTKRGTSIHSFSNIFESRNFIDGGGTLESPKTAKNNLQEFSYKRGDWLVFGSETCGLPQESLLDCMREGTGGGTIRIPMIETYVRCLNLSVSVGIALYEASRQLNYEQLQCPSEAVVDSERLFISEDVFG